MKKIFLSVLTLFLLGNVIAQKEANVWYVGSNIKMDFSGGGDPFVGNGITTVELLPENSTAISDANGNVLFAVVGDKIYDGDQNPVFDLPNGTWDVAQGTIIFPIPEVKNKYYLCVLQSKHKSTSPTSIYYEINVTGTGANNIVVSPAKNLVENLTQAQAGVPKINPNFFISDDYWLVTHEKCNNNFKVFSVTSTGINLATTQAVGSNLRCTTEFPPIIDVIGVMKFNSCYTQMAYTIGGSVHLYDFDAQTGILTFVNEITSLSSDQPYGIEFSSDGSFLYVLTGQDNSHPGKIYSVSVGVDGLGETIFLGSTGGMRGGHLQMGPDGNIYYAVPEAFGNAGKGKIGRITNVDEGGTLQNEFYSASKAVAFDTSVDQWVNMDMPTFVKSFVSNVVTLKINGQTSKNNILCIGKTADFQVEIDRKQIAGLQWQATGANTASQTGGNTFSVLMTNKGKTKINVTVQDNCGRLRNLEFDVDVIDNVTADATVDLSTCPNQTLVGTSPITGITNYEWYDADPKAGGKLLSISSTYQYIGTGDVWIQAAGTVTNLGIDSRIGSGYGNVVAAGTYIIVRDVVNISSAKFNAYLWSGSLVGKTWTATLKNSAGTTIGNPVTGVFTGANAETVTVKGDGWVNLPPDTYKLIYTGSVNTIETVRGIFNGGNKIIVTGGNFYGFVAQQVEELPCIVAKKVIIDNCQITSSLSFQQEEVSVYPNPFTNTISINNVSSSIDKIQLVDVYGNVVEEISNPSENVEMGETISSGTYFIYLHSAENVEIQKVVKIK